MSEASAPVVEKPKVEPSQGTETVSSKKSPAETSGEEKQLARGMRRLFRGVRAGRTVGIHEGMEALAGNKPLDSTSGGDASTSGEPTKEGLRLSVAQVTDQQGEDALRSEAALMAHAKRGGSKEGPSIAPIAEDASKWEKTKHYVSEGARLAKEGVKETAKHPGEAVRKMWEGRVTRGAVHALQERNAAAMLVSAGMDTALSKPLMDAIQEQAQSNISSQRAEQGKVENAMMTVKERLKIATAQRKALESQEIDIAGKLNEAISTPADKQSPELKAFIEKHRSADQGGTGLMDKYIQERSGSYAAKSVLAESVSLADTVSEVQLTGKAKDTFAEALAPIVQQRLLGKGSETTKEAQLRENIAVEQALLQTAYALPDGEVRQQILSSVSRAGAISKGIDQLAAEAEAAVSHVKGAAAVDEITQFITEMPAITIETAQVADTSLAEVAKSRSRVTEKAFQRLREAQGTPEFADAMRSMDHAAARVGMLDSGLVESVAAAGAAMGTYAAEIGGRKAGRVLGAWVGGTAVAGAFGARRGIREANMDIALARTGEARGQALGQKGELKNIILPLADTKGTSSNVQQAIEGLREAGDTQQKLETAIVGLAQVDARNRAGDAISKQLWDGSTQDLRELDRQKGALALEVQKIASAQPDVLRGIAEKAGIEVAGDTPEAYVTAIQSEFADALEQNIQSGVDLGEILGGALAGQEVDRSIKDVQRAERNLKVKKTAIETGKIAAFGAAMIGGVAAGEAALDGAAASAQGFGEPGQAESVGNVSSVAAVTVKEPELGKGGDGSLGEKAFDFIKSFPQPENAAAGEPVSGGEDPQKFITSVKEHMQPIKERTFVDSPAEQGFHTLLINPDAKDPTKSYVRLEMNSDKAKQFAFELRGIGTVFVEGEVKDGKTILDLNSAKELKFANGDPVMVGKESLALSDVSKLLVNTDQVVSSLPQEALQQPAIDIATEMQPGGNQTFNLVDTISAVNLDEDKQAVEYYASIHGGGVDNFAQGIAEKLKGMGLTVDEKTGAVMKDGKEVFNLGQAASLQQAEITPHGNSFDITQGDKTMKDVRITPDGITYEGLPKPITPEQFVGQLTGAKTPPAGEGTGQGDGRGGFPGEKVLTSPETRKIVGKEVTFPKGTSELLEKRIVKGFSNIKEEQVGKDIKLEFDASKGAIDIRNDKGIIVDNVTFADDGTVTYEKVLGTNDGGKFVLGKDWNENQKNITLKELLNPQPPEREPGTKNVMIAGDTMSVPENSKVYEKLAEYQNVFKDLPEKYPLEYDTESDTITITDKNKPDVNLGEGVTITEKGELHGKFRGEWDEDKESFILDKDNKMHTATIPLEKLLNPTEPPPASDGGKFELSEQEEKRLALGAILGVVGIGTLGLVINLRNKTRRETQRLDAAMAYTPGQTLETPPATSPDTEAAPEIVSSPSEENGSENLTATGENEALEPLSADEKTAMYLRATKLRAESNIQEFSEQDKQDSERLLYEARGLLSGLASQEQTLWRQYKEEVRKHLGVRVIPEEGRTDVVFNGVDLRVPRNIAKLGELEDQIITVKSVLDKYDAGVLSDTDVYNVGTGIEALLNRIRNMAPRT